METIGTIIFIAVLGYYSAGEWVEKEKGEFDTALACLEHVYKLPKRGGARFWCAQAYK